MPTDSIAFLNEWKGRSLDGPFIFHSTITTSAHTSPSAIVEQVREGTSLRTRLLMPDGEHQMINVLLAGVRSPKVSSKPGDVSEPWGEEVGYITTSPCTPSFCSINLHLSLGQVLC